MSFDEIIKEQGFHCAHLNCRSLLSKFEVLDQLLINSGSNLHILGLSETWLTNSIPDSFLKVDGYEMSRLNRGWSQPDTNTIKKGGGLCLYIRDTLQWNDTKFSFLNLNKSHLEIQWIEIENVHSRNFIIANAYRPPGGNVGDFRDSLEAAMNSLDLTKYDVFIMGDLNLDYFDNKIAGVKDLKLLLKQFGFIQHIVKPTRYSTNKDSCLDLICSNSNSIAHANVCDVNISDHELVIITRKHIKVKDKKTSFIGRSYKNYNKERFVNQLRNLNWNFIHDDTDPVLLWENLISQIKKLIDQTCPLKRFKVRVTNKPWITNEIIEQIKDKDRALKKAKRTNNPDDWIRARRLRNDCLRTVRNAKSTFIQAELNTHFDDPKKFWDNVSSILPINSKETNVIKLKNQITNEIVDDDKTADFINDFFSNVGENLASNFRAPWSYKGPESDVVMDNIQTDLREVLSLINEIDINKSSAIEYLSSRILKDAFTVIPDILLQIFNASLASGLVPNSWKKATVIPLKKCGNSTDVNNLRPISLLPIQGKMLEKIIHKRLLSHLDENKLLDQKQGGFRPNHSTIDTIVKFSENIYKQVNEGDVVIATYIDLKKAFDTVNHSILIQKLRKVGIKNTNLIWIENYLTNRSQTTLANGIASSSRPVRCGVPQGSVLGPLLFLIYVNDLGHTLNASNHFLYADDTVIFHSGKNINVITNTLQADLNSYGSWCKANKLTINTKKSNFVIYGTNQKLAHIRDCQIKLNNEPLARTHSYKYLGVYLDERLNFNAQIDNCCKIVSHKLYLLSKVRRNITVDTCTRVYKSMIAPLLDYGDIIYSATSDRNLARIQKLQNRGLRICLNNHVYVSRIQLHQTCEVLPLKIRRKYNLRKYMFKQKENQNIIVNREIRTRRHRAVVFETNRPNIEMYKRGTLYKGALEWNNLPVDTRNTEKFVTFKEIQKKEMYELLPFINGSHFHG